MLEALKEEEEIDEKKSRGNRPHHLLLLLEEVTTAKEFFALLLSLMGTTKEVKLPPKYSIFSLLFLKKKFKLTLPSCFRHIHGSIMTLHLLFLFLLLLVA